MKYNKYYPKYWYIGMLLITSIAFTSYIGLEIYNIFQAYNLPNSIEVKKEVLNCSINIIIGTLIVCPIHIINYALDYYKKREIQLVLIFIELFIMMVMMLKLLFVLI